MKRNIAILFFLFAAAAAVFLIMYPKLKETKPRPKVTSFEECMAAGYPVMESYPRQCRVPNGELFVEKIIEENNQRRSTTTP